MSAMKQINLNQSVYEICKTYPEVADIMADLGFTDIAKPGMLQTAGRFMTLPKGAQMKNIDMNLIVEKFREKGFELVKG